MSSTHSTFGRFAAQYRMLARLGRQGRNPNLDDTPVVLIEGDSWVAMPPVHDLGDHLERGAGGVFLRLGHYGDTAASMFDRAGLRRLEGHLQHFAFDVIVASAGGNDLVDALEGGRGRAPLFPRNHPAIDPVAGLARVRAAGVLERVRERYEALLRVTRRAGVPVIGHSYDYPRRMGAPARLTVEQVGLIAVLKRSCGDWIQRHIRHVMPDESDQLAFTHGLIDAFVDDVLAPITEAGVFSWVDFRGLLPDVDDWNDEIHPTSAGFERLARPLKAAIRGALPAAKRRGW
jgi:lysophospholipase L1-like esterase